MSNIQRVKKLCKWLIYQEFADNDKELALLLGYTKSSFSQIINEKVSLSDKFIDKICEVDKNVNKVWIRTGKGDMFKKNTIPSDPLNNSIPLIPVDAFAGFGGGTIRIMDNDIMDRYVVPDFTNVDFMIRVKGSSMYPKYNSGDVVACKMINSDSFLQWNKVHVIATREQGVLIKRLKKSKQEGCITAISDNPSYDPFDIPNDEILNIALVTGVIRLE